MMTGLGIVGTVGILAVLVVIGIAVFMIRQGQKFKLTDTPPGEKPEWMRSLPPEETQATLKAKGEKMAVFEHTSGEKLAAPFAEQIEDMVRTLLQEDPELKSTQIDFGTAPDGSLEFIIAGIPYASLEDIPVSRIKEIIQQAIQRYNQIS